MKNSEMKTIIRHIDRLTRNLNAKRRRRDAGSEEEMQRHVVERQREKKQNAALGVKHYCVKVLNDMLDIQNDCKSLFPDLAKRADFESIIKSAKKDIDSLKNVAKDLKQVIAFCNEGINAI